MILFVNGNFIRVVNDGDFDTNGETPEIPGWFALEFAGAFLATLFWVSDVAVASTPLTYFVMHEL